MNVHQRPTVGRMLVRGITRRCASCGGRGAFFISWFTYIDRCRTCGFKWQRNLDGFQLGAAAMSAMFTLGSLLTVMVIGVVYTYPDIPVVPLAVSTCAVALIVGIGGYPISYTMWMAVDLAMNPPDETEL
ncbi:MAG: hypothetical protein D4R44_04745 [Actinobacteria bacterium]|nr:MAG: hypothetical protein D4R44_04745 [Actinomycetota bacterium]